MYKSKMAVDTYNTVGPYTDLYDHGPVTFVQNWFEVAHGGYEIEDSLFVCLDCGFTSETTDAFAEYDCEPERNHVNQTWRDKLGDALDG